jgi:ABC-type sugar transport system permease subunit
MILKNLNPKKLKGNLNDLAYLSPQLVLYTIFIILPFFIGFPMMFTNMRSLMDVTVQWVGLENFRTILFDRDAYEHQLFINSVYRNGIFFLLNYFFVYAFGLSFALFMYKGRFGQGFFTIVYLPMMVSGLAMGFMATMLFAKSSGSLNLLLLRLGIIKKAINIQSDLGSMFLLPLIVGWQYAGYNMGIFLSGLYSIPEETVEAAIVDGANGWQRLTKVLMPQMWPSIIIATVMCITGSFQIFDQAVALGALGGNKNVEFVVVAFFKLAFSARGGNAIAKATAMTMIVAVPLLLVSGVLLLLQRRVQQQ